MAWIICAVVFVMAVGVAEPASSFRWCAYEKEMKKCDDFIKALPTLENSTGVASMKASCIKVTSDEDCMKKIKDNEADYITLDAGKVYSAGKNYGLVPIVGEETAGSLGYYGVAVAKKNKDVTLKNLKGKKTCHTGFRRTAGWLLPVGWFLQQDGFRAGCGENVDANSASKYFKESCVPGVPPGFSNLCALCPNKNCKKDNNAYAGYTGAFKCMQDDVGDVAFVKHLTTKEVVGNDTSGYKYLCTDGSSKDVTPTSHENCNFARSISHTVVGRAGDNSDVSKILVQASIDCVPSKAAANCNGFKLFESKSYGGQSNLLFKDSATKLVDVGEKKTYTKWLGDDYVKDVEALSKDKVCSSGSITTVLPGAILAMFTVVKALF